MAYIPIQMNHTRHTDKISRNRVTWQTGATHCTKINLLECVSKSGTTNEAILIEFLVHSAERSFFAPHEHATKMFLRPYPLNELCAFQRVWIWGSAAFARTSSMVLRYRLCFLATATIQINWKFFRIQQLPILKCPS